MIYYDRKNHNIDQMTTVGLCKYKDALGVPKQGFHAKRVMGFAANDVYGTIGIAAIITLILWLVYKKPLLKTFLISVVALFVLGILLHRLFCVNTTLNMMIFGKV